MKNKLILGTPYRAMLHVTPEISISEGGDLVVEGLPGVTYEMCGGNISFSAYSDSGELNYEGAMTDWEITLDGKPLEEGMEYFVLDEKKMELIETILDPESEWSGKMYWKVQDALIDLKREFEGELLKVCELKFDGPPHYLLKI